MIISSITIHEGSRLSREHRSKKRVRKRRRRSKWYCYVLYVVNELENISCLMKYYQQEESIQSLLKKATIMKVKSANTVKTEEEGKAIVEENAKILEAITDIEPEHDVFRIDDNQFHPGLTKEDEELQEISLITAQATLATAQTTLDARIAEEKNKQNGSTAL